MSLKINTPCDLGDCPYNVEYGGSCEFYCGAEEPQDDPDIWEEDELEEFEDVIDWYIDLSVDFYDGECSRVHADFPMYAADFELDTVLRRVLPKYTYDQFMRGEIYITGVGEDGYLTKGEIHKSLFEFVNEGKTVLELGVVWS